MLWVAAMHSNDGRIDAHHIAAALQVEPAVAEAAPIPPEVSRPRRCRLRPLTLRPSGTWSAATCRDLLAVDGGNRRAVAAALQVSERTVYRKLKRYGLS